MDIDYWHTLFGVGVIVAATYTLWRRSDFARGVYGWYRSIPEGKFGPRWFRWQYRPSHRQSEWIASLTGVAGLALGGWMVVSSAF